MSKIFHLLFLFLLCLNNSFAQQKIIWSDIRDYQIQIANLDGSDKQTIIAGNKVFFHTIDAVNQKLYWSDAGTQAVHRMNLDGTEQEVIISGLENPKGICLDANNNIFLVDAYRIVKYSTEGAYLATIHEDVFNAPLDIAINGSELFWITFNGEVLDKSNLDGSGKTTVSTELIYPEDLEIDPVTQKMYWTDYNLGSVNKADLDGTNVESIITTDFPASEQKNSLFLDEVAQKIYYSEGSSSGKIKRANFDGSDIEVVNLSIFYGPSDMTLVSGALVGLEDASAKANSTKIYPNPFSETLTLENPEGIHSLTIYNALGQVCKSRQFEGQQQVEFSGLDDLKKGVYCVVIRSRSGTYETQLTLKQ